MADKKERNTGSKGDAEEKQIKRTFYELHCQDNGEHCEGCTSPACPFADG